MPSGWLLDWTATAINGIWRQSHGYRMCDLLEWQRTSHTWQRSCKGYDKKLVTVSSRPLTIISGGGRFYSWYFETFQYQSPHYRHILVNGSDAQVSGGLTFYEMNPEHSAGEAEMEITDSHGVSIYGLKAEKNFCLLWVRRSSSILLTGFGGSAEALYSNHTWAPGVPGYQPGYSSCVPACRRRRIHGSAPGHQVSCAAGFGANP